MAREEDMDKTEDLDNEFRTIRSLLDIRKNPLPDPQESEKVLGVEEEVARST